MEEKLWRWRRMKKSLDKLKVNGSLKDVRWNLLFPLLSSMSSMMFDWPVSTSHKPETESRTYI